MLISSNSFSKNSAELNLKNQIHLPSPAKLNLFLHIIGRKENGYHKLQTLFQFIDVCDQLIFTLIDNDPIDKDDSVELLNPINGVATKDNLIYQAAKMLLPYRSKKTTQGIKIALEKQLPMGGGIGGGSSNAATTLLALNQLWQCNLSHDELAKIGLELGADVPIFILGKSAFAEGVGEVLTEVSPIEPYYLLLKPNCEVQTSQIFNDKDLTRDTPAIKISHALKLNKRNDCLEVVRKHNPDVNDAYNWLKSHGDAQLTGTGSCLFSAFTNLDDAIAVKEIVPSQWQSWVCRGCNVSPTHHMLHQWIKNFGV